MTVGADADAASRVDAGVADDAEGPGRTYRTHRARLTAVVALGWLAGIAALYYGGSLWMLLTR